MSHESRIDYHFKVVLKLSDILYTKIDIERKKLKETKCSYQTTPKVFSSLESTKKVFSLLHLDSMLLRGKRYVGRNLKYFVL